MMISEEERTKQLMLEELLVEAPEEDTEEETDSEESSNEEGEDSSEGTEEDNSPFQNLDLNDIICFGFSHPKKDCWTTQTIKSQTIGWNKIDVKSLEENLSKNVEATYFYLATAWFTDLDDETKYQVLFENDSGLWKLMIDKSPDADIDLETKAAFFSSDIFKKTAERVFELVSRANKLYTEVVDKHLREGELIEVDEVKLERILYLLGQKLQLESLRTCKWMK